MKFQKKRSILIKRKYIMIFAPILTAIIVLLIVLHVVSVNKEKSERQQAVDQLNDIGVINIGLRGDLGALCSFNSETDEFEGLEKDVADEIVRRLYGDEILVNYIEINSETKEAMIRAGELDIALGASLKQSISGVNYTTSYYADGSAFLVIEGDMEQQSSLNGRRIAIVQDSLATETVGEDNENQTRMEVYLTANDINAEVVLYASYPEAVSALQDGHVGAVCASEIFLKHYGKMGMLMLTERFMPHRFRVEVSSSLGMFNDVVSDTISEMKEDGTLTGLYEKWNLVDYSALED